MAMIQTTRTPKVAIHSEASRVVSQVVTVAGTRSRSSSRLVEGVVVLHSDMDTSIDGRCFDAGFGGMMLHDDIRMLHDSLSEMGDSRGLEWSD